MSFLKFIKWSELENWSANFYFQKIRKNTLYPLVAFKNILQEQKKKIKPFEQPDKKFGILGVNNKIGLFDNEILLGKDIKQPYKIVENNFLAYNPYRVNVGSIGIKTKEQNFDLISSAYIVFSCDESKILSEFLFLVFKTENFNQIIKDNTKGSVRQTLSFDILSSLQIPLPPIDIQEKIVENYQNKITEISNLKSQNEIIEQNAKDYLLQTLGLDSSNSQSKFDETDKILRFKKYSKIKDWSVESNFRDDNIDNNEFVWLSLQKISSYIQRGKTPVYSNFKKIPVISQKCNQFDGFHLENALFISPDTINKYSNERFLQENDLLLNSTGTGTLGRVALFVPEKEYPIVVADGHVTVIRINKNVNYKYIFYTFKFINNQEKLDCISVGSTKQKELSLSIVKDIQIPLPPLDIQKQIVEYLDDLQRQIDDNKAKISNLEFLAKDEFEKAVFG